VGIQILIEEKLLKQIDIFINIFALNKFNILDY